MAELTITANLENLTEDEFRKIKQDLSATEEALRQAAAEAEGFGDETSVPSC